MLDAAGVMREMGDADGQIYREIAEVFLADLPVALARLRDAGDVAALLVPALHELANSLGAVGGRRAETRARDLERRLLDGETFAPGDVTRETETALQAVEAALSAWLAA